MGVGNTTHSRNLCEGERSEGRGWPWPPKRFGARIAERPVAIVFENPLSKEQFSYIALESSFGRLVTRGALA